MKKKLLTIALLATALVTSGYVVYRRTRADATPAYRTATVQRGNIESTVSATGSLGAVTTVQVGTQVSGQIAAIYADFNTKVKKGQLLARIDPTLQQQAVADAETGVARANATLQQTQGDYAREKQLHDSGFATDPEFETAQLNYQVAVANGKSAQIALDKAKQNLAYTSIYAPIDGIVVERDVDVGQTVAASLSAPQLFVIANDLSQMQILATVDESDIGQIRDGQPVTFTVQAYPGETFTGSVRQVRINSATVNNVVNYTAVIAVANPNAKLLPGIRRGLGAERVAGAERRAAVSPGDHDQPERCERVSGCGARAEAADWRGGFERHDLVARRAGRTRVAQGAHGTDGWYAHGGVGCRAHAGNEHRDRHEYRNGDGRGECRDHQPAAVAEQRAAWWSSRWLLTGERR